MDATSGVTPPFLPTLLVAVVLGAASLICREPEAPAPVPATAISTTLAPRGVAAPRSVVEPVATGSIAETFLPATLAFPRQFPLVLAAQAVAPPQASPRRSAGPRVATLRRTAPAKAPAEAVHAEAAQADPIPHVAGIGAKGAAGRTAPDGPMPDPSLPDLAFPDLALPFAPAIEAAGRVRDFVGGQGAAARTQATALGGAVVEFVEALR